MGHYTTLEHPADVVRHLTNVVGKSKVREIRFGYRLDNEEPAIKFKIWLRFPYNFFSRKQVEEQVEHEISHIKLSSDLPSKLLFQVQ
jgi:hypothetical protein